MLYFRYDVSVMHSVFGGIYRVYCNSVFNY